METKELEKKEVSEEAKTREQVLKNISTTFPPYNESVNELRIHVKGMKTAENICDGIIAISEDVNKDKALQEKEIDATRVLLAKFKQTKTYEQTLLKYWSVSSLEEIEKQLPEEKTEE